MFAHLGPCAIFLGTDARMKGMLPPRTRRARTRTGPTPNKLPRIATTMVACACKPTVTRRPPSPTARVYLPLAWRAWPRRRTRRMRQGRPRQATGAMGWALEAPLPREPRRPRDPLVPRGANLRWWRGLGRPSPPGQVVASPSGPWPSKGGPPLGALGRGGTRGDQLVRCAFGLFHVLFTHEISFEALFRGTGHPFARNRAGGLHRWEVSCTCAH